MSRKAVAHRRAQLLIRSRAELETERDRLRAVTDDCGDPSCWCHWHDWNALVGVLFLLGEDVPGVPPRWTEEET
jgi:hypothetical protein